MTKHHKIRVILAGSSGSKRESFKLWLLTNPNSIPILLALKLRKLTS